MYEPGSVVSFPRGSDEERAFDAWRRELERPSAITIREPVAGPQLIRVTLNCGWRENFLMMGRVCVVLSALALLGGVAQRPLEES